MNERNLLKSLVILLIGITMCSLNLYAVELSPLEIMQRVDDRDDGDTSTANIIMVNFDRSNQQRKLELRSFRKDYGKDKKSILFFLAPADKKNVSFLSWEKDNEDEEEDKWLYLPAGRIKTRISGGKKKDPFMGSEFSYADMESTDIEDWEYKFIDRYSPKDKTKLETVIEAQECWIIEATPKKEKLKKILDETGYLKRVSWIRKDNFMVVHGRIWVKKGKRTKLFFARKIELIQGIWTAKELEMRTYKGSIQTQQSRANNLERRTVLVFADMSYNNPIDDAMFTVQQMMIGL